jgi:hypothetical protein
MAADNLLSWKSSDGTKRCLLIITDEEKHHKQFGYRKIELCEMKDEEWKTVEKIDTIDELESFGIPPGMVG